MGNGVESSQPIKQSATSSVYEFTDVEVTDDKGNTFYETIDVVISKTSPGRVITVYIPDP